MRNPTVAGLLAAILYTVRASAGSGAVLHVDDDAPPGGDGLTWATAYRFLQDALADASRGGGAVVEIRVAQGAYLPDRSEAASGGSGDREASFGLIEGVSLLGGFAGPGRPDPDERDPASYLSLLSGDLAGDGGGGSPFDNSYHVVTAVGIGAGRGVLDGFTIEGGHADGFEPPLDRGAGLYAADSDFTVRLCRFMGNHAPGICADAGGGAMYIDGGSVQVELCEFVVNTACGRGGGIHARGAELVLAGCVFQGNVADGPEGDGGGLATTAATAFAVSCRFEGNAGRFGGGGVCNAAGALALVNCLVAGNLSGGGGGVADKFGGAASIVNCTIAGNHGAGGGGGVLGGGATAIANSILWANTTRVRNEQITGGASVSFSDVQGGWPGSGNIASDPSLADPAGGDYRLSPGSACIDAASAAALPAGIATDLDGNPRFVDDPGTADCAQSPGLCGGAPLPDMGAYELQAGPRLCPWDLDADGAVGVMDLLALLAAAGECGEPCPADFDGDGVVGVADLLALIGAFGPCPGAACAWDVNGDGIVDTSDLHEVVAHAGPCEDPRACPWDVNGDGTVDGQDVAEVATHLGPCP